MDYEAQWKALRDDQYISAKYAIHVGMSPGKYISILYWMICQEDAAAGIDTEKRHYELTREKNEVSASDVIALYEARKR